MQIWYVVCQDTVQDNEAEQEMQEGKLWAKMVGKTGIHDQKSAAFAAQFSSDHCSLGTVSLW